MFVFWFSYYFFTLSLYVAYVCVTQMYLPQDLPWVRQMGSVSEQFNLGFLILYNFQIYKHITTIKNKSRKKIIAAIIQRQSEFQ